MAVLPLSAVVFLKDPIKSLALPAAALSLLAGCMAFEPETVPCPEIKVIKGYENVRVTGETLGQDVTMRVNGVDAFCTDIEAGRRMNVDLGLMIKRPAMIFPRSKRSMLMSPLPISMPMVISSAGRSLAMKPSSRALRRKSRPIMRMKLDVPDETRVVFGLGKALD